jgi:gamma-butyrobetaine dioxygenase
MTPGAAGEAVELMHDDRSVTLLRGLHRHRIWSYWLRLASTEAGLYDGTARRWTDGANFHPQAPIGVDQLRLVDAAVTPGALRVRWADGHVSVLGLADLVARLDEDPVNRLARRPWADAAGWTTYPLADLADDEVRRQLMESFFVDGVVFISGVPKTDRAILDVAGLLGGVEPSHLGEVFTIHRKERSQHIGEEMGEIPLHIDLVYRQRPPEVQVLHALTQIAEGGENVFVDIEQVALALDADVLEWLFTVGLDFVAASEQVHFRGRHRVLSIAADGRLQVAYNQYKVRFPLDTPHQFYEAFEAFRRTIHDPGITVTFQLPEDHVVVFDNRRVLHGRLAFTDPRRHVNGCFVSGDDLRSSYRMLESGHRCPA